MRKIMLNVLCRKAYNQLCEAKIPVEAIYTVDDVVIYCGQQDLEKAEFVKELDARVVVRVKPILNPIKE